jgi:hypothetical protein
MHRSKAILAITAVMVVLWSNTALGSNGDPIRAGRTTTAKARTTLSSDQASGEGLRVVLAGSTSGAAVRAQNGAKGNGVSGFASAAGAYGVSGTNTAATHGHGAGGFFNGRNNDGVVGRTTSGFASGVHGVNTGGEGAGVRGTAGDTGIGVFGENTGNGYAAYFDGPVNLHGNVQLQGLLSCVGCLLPTDATRFIQGQAVALGPGVFAAIGPALEGFLQLLYECPANLANNGTLHIRNNSSGPVNVFVDSGGPNPSYSQMNSLDEITFPAAATADSFHIQAQGALGVLTVEVATVHRAGDCHAQAQGVLS